MRTAWDLFLTVALVIGLLAIGLWLYHTVVTGH